MLISSNINFFNFHSLIFAYNSFVVEKKWNKTSKSHNFRKVGISNTSFAKVPYANNELNMMHSQVCERNYCVI